MPSLAPNATCEVCFELFDQHLRKPCTAAAGCGHILCLYCYQQGQFEGRCPFCQNPMGAGIRLRLGVNTPQFHSQPHHVDSSIAYAEAEVEEEEEECRHVDQVLIRRGSGAYQKRLLREIDTTLSAVSVDPRIVQFLLRKCQTFLQSHDDPGQIQGLLTSYHILRRLSVLLEEREVRARQLESLRWQLEYKRKWRIDQRGGEVVSMGIILFIVVLFQDPSNPWACRFFQSTVARCNHLFCGALKYALGVSSLVHRQMFYPMVTCTRQMFSGLLSVTKWCVSGI